MFSALAGVTGRGAQACPWESKPPLGSRVRSPPTRACLGLGLIIPTLGSLPSPLPALHPEVWPGSFSSLLLVPGYPTAETGAGSQDPSTGSPYRDFHVCPKTSMNLSTGTTMTTHRHTAHTHRDPHSVPTDILPTSLAGQGHYRRLDPGASHLPTPPSAGA